MIILLISIAGAGALLYYFYVCELKASVFPKLGFVNDEVPIDKIQLRKYFSVENFGDSNNDKRSI